MESVFRTAASSGGSTDLGWITCRVAGSEPLGRLGRVPLRVVVSLAHRGDAVGDAVDHAGHRPEAFQHLLTRRAVLIHELLGALAAPPRDTELLEPGLQHL